MAHLSSEERIDLVRQRAVELWQQAGSPPSGPTAYEELAEELIAIEEAEGGPTLPVDPSYPEEDIEPLEAVENQGEFPTLTDQGEDNPYPLRPDERREALD